MLRLSPRSTLTDTLFPYTTLFRSKRMFGAIAKAIFGSSNDRYVKSMRPLVAKINALEPQFEAMCDEELQNQTQQIGRAHVELQSLMRISYAVFCLKKKNKKNKRHNANNYGKKME